MDDKEFINLGNNNVISKAAYLEAFKKSKSTNIYYNGKVVGNYTDFKIDENGNIVYTIKFTDDKILNEISKNNIVGISSCSFNNINEYDFVGNIRSSIDKIIIKNNESND